jgi:hypothetical protein
MEDLEIDLTNPKLGEELLKDAQGDLPIEVWIAYFWQHDLIDKEVFVWCVDPDDPDFQPIDPQQAVDQALPLVNEVIKHLRSNSPHKALVAALQVNAVLLHGWSRHQRGKGLPPTMQHQAVRAWVIRKFNPHPSEEDRSTVSWSKLADLLFLKNGKCPRNFRDVDGKTKVCGASRHQYDDPCVKALTTAVGNLKSTMENDGIPL